MEFLSATLTTGVLFTLFQVKDVKKGKWVSFSSQPRMKIFELITSNFKWFKDQFFKVLASEHKFLFFLDEKDHTRFPLYWNRYPKRVLNVDTIASSHMTKWSLFLRRALVQQEEGSLLNRFIEMGY